ncbi:MAG: hypothetical protein FOGNACKC_03100 [Anaerolineae bacterium]|nr:hypothetical protein [Anaerolineae bacterium]
MNRLPVNPAQQKYLWPAVLAVILVAFFFRFYRLADHPLGIFFDPAINGLDAERLMQRGGPVIFFPTNGGREAMFMYMLIPSIWLFGSTPFALRAVTATASLLNVVLLFAFIYDLRKANYELRITNYEWRHSQLIFALLAALTLATMPWAIEVSRLGQRPVLVPLLAVPIFWFFLRGWAGGGRGWFIASGALLGLAGHTYSAARLLPLILLLALLPEIFIRSQGAGAQATPSLAARHSQFKIQNSKFFGLLLFAAAAGVVFAPMGWYLLTHPAQFTERAGSVMVWNFLNTPAAIAAEIGHNALRVAGFFCCAGSPNPIFGLPGYPGLSPLLAPFLLLGLALALKNWRNLFYRLVALWWLIGIAPSVIAIEAPHPLRMIAALPATAILVALGLVQLPIITDQLSKKLPPRFQSYGLQFAFHLLPILLILLPLPGLFRAYFIDWTARQDTRGVYDYGAIAIRDAVLAHADDSTAVYLPLARFGDSPLLYYLSGPFKREARTTVTPAPNAIVIAPEKNAADAAWVRLFNGRATLLPPLNPFGQQLIQSALASDSAQTILIPFSNEPAARLAPLAQNPAPYIQGVTDVFEASFGAFELTGATYPQIINSPGALPVTLFWQANQPVRDEVEVLVRLVDDNQRAWGNGDGRPTGWAYPTSWWRPGLDRIAAQHQVQLDNALPPGRYRLAISVYDPAAGQRWPLTGGHSDSPDTFFIGPLKVPLPPPAKLPPLLPDPPVFGNEIELLGYRLEPASLTPGGPVQLELLWQAQTTPTQDYTVFIHLLDEAGNQLDGSDSPPLAGSYPTSIWSPGERILDPHTLPLPANLPPGSYRLALGWYHQPTGQRLPLSLPDGSPAPDDRWLLPQPLSTGP